ncbi:MULTISPECIES: NusG domain II-containing protein [unclassified Paenibacillus]|uniref:NusG domain II-containing protein n=1 Tax=unclassified Paenibacillus TaxID=185978 RepID=UPI0024060304|nr:MULTISPECIES: NusG domain II-containing protein [unclassified Paenibacillus]
MRKDRPDTGTYASIRIDNKLYKEIELTDEPQVIKVQTKRGYDILKVHDRGIEVEVIESDCPTDDIDAIL